MASASKRVLITGLDSFTGRHLGRYLSGAGYQVFGTSRQSGNADNLWQCDIADADQCVQMIQAARPDYVIHLAGISFVGHMPPEDFYKVKLFATGGDLVIEKSIIYEMDEIMKHPLDEA